MISYRDYQLPQSTIDYLKEKNARQSIAKYIEEHGEEPSDISQFFIVSPGEIEQYKRVSYAKLLTSGNVLDNQDEEQEELVTCSLNFSAIDDNILSSSDEILRGDNDNYQYTYWRILVERHGENGPCGRNTWKIGNFTSLNNVSLVLDTRLWYTFYIYLRKSNYLYEYMRTGVSAGHAYIGGHYIGENEVEGIFDNEFHDCSIIWFAPGSTNLAGNTAGLLFTYEDSSTCPKRYYSANDYTLDYSIHTFDSSIAKNQMYDKEYIGTVLNFKPEYGKNISGTVYTFNPKLKIVFNNFTKDSGTITLSLKNIENDNIQFWYENDLICTNGDGNITEQTETSFSYTLPKYEFAKMYDIGALPGRMAHNDGYIDHAFQSYPAPWHWENPDVMLTHSRKTTFSLEISKDGYIPNSLNGINYSIIRNGGYISVNSSSVVSVDVPEVGTETEPGVEINIVDDEHSLPSPVIKNIQGANANGTYARPVQSPEGDGQCVMWDIVHDATSYSWRLLDELEENIIENGTTTKTYVDASIFPSGRGTYIFYVKAVNDSAESLETRVIFTGTF